MSDYNIEENIEKIIGVTFPIEAADRYGDFRELDLNDYEGVLRLVEVNKTLAVYFLKRKLIGYNISVILYFIECVVCKGQNIGEWEKERSGWLKI
ncbi:hypothetical protein ONV78_10455 [Hahella sp. CR1]|uniref:hypothetical protein n=1 Tax=Hahella sp. CR1 TaxID=2992807 RepID=UPI0024433B33|nr:hypothetical protein [Hahella sp. CR1]MDG9668156.1 hypothetical protein [Hahella sp. CR1]